MNSTTTTRCTIQLHTRLSLRQAGGGASSFHFTRSPEPVASSIVTNILNAKDTYLVHRQLNEQVSTNGWSEAIAKVTLRALENAIKAGTEIARATAGAAAQSKDAAVDFAAEHPVYVILIALGILALLTPWILEIIGFGDVQ